MKILLINNYSEFFGNLKESLSDHDVYVAPFDRECVLGLDEFDCVILSGGSRYEVMENEDLFEEEMEMIRNSEKPILGICLGLQVIGRAFGEEVERLGPMREGVDEIPHIVEEDKILSGINPTLKVFKSHEWGIRNPKNLKLIAHSDCAEVVKHPEKPIYGVQFHPEMDADGTNGIKILHNFLDMVEDSSA